MINWVVEADNHFFFNILRVVGILIVLLKEVVKSHTITTFTKHLDKHLISRIWFQCGRVDGQKGCCGCGGLVNFYAAKLSLSCQSIQLVPKDTINSLLL